MVADRRGGKSAEHLDVRTSDLLSHHNVVLSEGFHVLENLFLNHRGRSAVFPVRPPMKKWIGLNETPTLALDVREGGFQSSARHPASAMLPIDDEAGDSPEFLRVIV